MMKFKTSLRGGQNMAPFIRAVGEDLSTAGEMPCGLPTSTSAVVQPSKPLAPFGGCETPLNSTAGPKANQQGHVKDSFYDGEKTWQGLHCGSDGDKTRSKETTRWLALLSGACIVLLALVIWLATEVTDNRHAISQLRSQMQQALANDASLSASLNATSVGGVSSSSLSSSSDLSLGGGVNGVYLSSNATPPAGYTSGGSLYRGSGFWVSDSPLPVPRAEHGALVDPTAQVAYVVGGHDDRGNILSTMIKYDVILDEYSVVASMPAPRSNFASALLGGRGYVIGGFETANTAARSLPKACSWVYDEREDSWPTSPTEFCLVTPRSDACAAAINGKLYVVGGYGSGRNELSSIEEGDPTTGVWKKVGDLPTRRGDVACDTVNGLLYVAGGYFDPTGKSNVDAFVADFAVFDPATGVSTALAPLQQARGNAQMVATDDGRLMVLGGRAFINDEAIVAITDVEEYSVAADAWVQRAPLATPISHFAAAYLDAQIIAFGGQDACTTVALCSNGALATVGSFYDIPHPDVFVHLRNATQELAATVPQADVLLTNVPPGQGSGAGLDNTTSAVAGYSSQGNLFAGTGYWALQTILPTQLTDHITLTAGNDMYIIGGADWTAEQAENRMWVYDPVLQVYTLKALMPDRRTRFAAAVFNNQIWVIGGYNNVAGTGAPMGRANTTLVYSIADDSWSVNDAPLSIPRSDNCAAAVDGKLYTAGGYSENYTSTLNSVEVYDPNTNTWTAVPDMPTPRGDLMCATINNALVVIGGYYDVTGLFGPAASNFRAEVEAFDATAQTWSSLAPLLYARGDNAAVTLPGDRLFVMGGETGDAGDNRTSVATHEVEEYLADQNVWVPKAPMIFGRFRFDAAYSGGSIYAFGGEGTPACSQATGQLICDDRGTSTVESYADIDYPAVFVYQRDS